VCNGAATPVIGHNRQPSDKPQISAHRQSAEVGTRETRVQRGRRKGDAVVRRLVGELRVARQNAGVSQRALAADLDWTQSEVNRLEQVKFQSVPIGRLCEVASVLGLELSANWYPVGDSIRDKGHQVVRRRFQALVASPPYSLTDEAAFPDIGDLRSWDVLLRLEDVRIGVEIETRVRDLQGCVRRIRARQKNGGADAILLVLADTAHNRRIYGELRDALGPAFATPPDAIVSALRAGRAVPGSGVILI
jgi:transcriptional regulator with XRE-family HTH domain